MNKSEFVEEVSGVSGVSESDTKKVVEAFIQVVGRELAQGGEVAIQPLGKFETRYRAARVGQNPHTGEAISIPAKNAPAFKPSSKLKDAVA